jgi:perosamine synthetase
MKPFSIKPRYRIYTTLKDYLEIYKSLLLNRTTKGDDCRKFEKSICQYMGSSNALCMPQGRVAIYNVVRALIKPGQKVILSPYTIADVINMVICAGGIPVFADIDPSTCNIDPQNIEPLIDKVTSAVMVTHLHGLSCDMDQIMRICKKHNLLLIEDAAQAFGASFNGKKAGTFGNAGIFSFGMYKNLTSFYGGMVITPKNDLYSQIKNDLSRYSFSEFSWFHKKVKKGIVTDVSTSKPLFQSIVYWIFRWGHLKNIRFINKFVETELDLSGKENIPEHYLRKMTPMQARIAHSKLDKVDENNKKRIHYANLYYEGLKDLKGLTLPPIKNDGSHIYTYFPIQIKDRKKLVRWMTKEKSDIGVQHLKNTADLPAFKKYWRDCPNARKTANEVILLPTYPKYGEKMVKHNIKVIRCYFNNN